MAAIPIIGSDATVVWIELDSAGASSGAPARILQGIDCAGTIDAAIPAKGILLGAKNGSGVLKPALVDGSGNLLVALGGTATVAFASPPAVTISGTPAVSISGTVGLSGAIPAGGNVIGATKDAGSAYTESLFRFSVADASTGGPHYICAAPTAGQKIVVADLIISCAADLVIAIKEETTGTVLLEIDLAAKTPFQLTPRGLLKLDTADKRLHVTASGAGTVRVTTLVRSEA